VQANDGAVDKLFNTIGMTSQITTGI
jgi:hypothetical protein